MRKSGRCFERCAVPARPCSATDGCEPRCTTGRHNTHVTEEREVLYPWHPWCGHVVHVHQALDRRASAYFRCSLEAGMTGRWLEVPAWMFERATCMPMKLAGSPRINVFALKALGSLLADAAGSGLSGTQPSNVPVRRAGRDSCPANRRDADATPTPPSHGSSDRDPSIRFIPPTGSRTAVAAVPGGGSRDGHEPDGTDVERTRASSSRGNGGRASR